MILNAVMCVWNEEDIIESTIKHAFAQGCSSVFIVDNASSDRTVEIAVNAGAKLAATFKTRYFDEDKKVAHLNATVEYINNIINDNYIWWLYLDADEFPNFDSEFNILEILSNIDSSICAIHGFMFDHKPTHPPYYISGYHPADFQQICSKSSVGKFPLLRYDKNRPHLWSIGGAHDFITHGHTVPILKDAINIHHFPYRNPEFSLSRLKKLVHKNDDGSSRIDWHDSFLKFIHGPSTSSQYQYKYESLTKSYITNKYIELKTNSLPYDFTNIVRWYDIETEKNFKSSIYDKSVYLAIYYYFLRQYDIALCRFKDAFDVCDDIKIKLLLLTKISECFAYSDVDTAYNIMSDIIKYNNQEINDFINENYNYIIKKSAQSVIDKKSNFYAKIDFYNSIFPHSVAERYAKMTDKIKLSLFKNYSTTK